MLTLSVNPSTIVRKNAMIRLPASVASKKPARMADTVPPVTVTSSHGKRNRKARHADAPRMCSSLKPSACEKPPTPSRTVSLLRDLSWSSPLPKFPRQTSSRSMIPTTRRCCSRPGMRRNLWSTRSSHASSTLAFTGTATTRGTITSRSADFQLRGQTTDAGWARRPRVAFSSSIA